MNVSIPVRQVLKVIVTMYGLDTSGLSSLIPNVIWWIKLIEMDNPWQRPNTDLHISHTQFDWFDDFLVILTHIGVFIHMQTARQFYNVCLS